MAVYDDEITKTPTYDSDEDIASLERGKSALDDGAPTDQYDMSKLDDTNEGSVNINPDNEPIDPESRKAISEELSSFDNEDNTPPNLESPQSKKGLRGFVKRRSVKIAGAITGVLFGGSVFILPAALGPLEFIHLAQSLEGPHFGITEKASNTSLGRFYRFLQGRPTQSCVGKQCLGISKNVVTTKFTYLENRYKAKMIGQLKTAGFQVWTDKMGYLKGWRIDPTVRFTDDARTKPNPFYGKTQDEIRVTLEKAGVKKVDTKVVGGLGNNVYVESQYLFGRGQRSLNKFMMKAAGMDGLPGIIHSRILSKWTRTGFHPLRVVDQKINDAVKKWWTDLRKSNLDPNGGAGKISVTDGSTETDDGKTSNLDGTTADTNGVANALSPDKINALDALRKSKSLRVGVQVLDLTGYVCMARQVALDSQQLSYATNIVPLMALGMEAVSMGSQVQSGRDFNINTLELARAPFESYDSKTKKRTSWSQAASIRANNNLARGISLLTEEKDMITSSGQMPEFLKWTDTDPIPIFCDNAVIQIGAGIISLGFAVVTGGVATAVVGGLAGMLLSGPVMDFFTKLVTGKAIDVVAAQGATYGSYADYGVFLASNLQRLKSGGSVLTPQQASQLINDNNSQEIAALNSGSFYDKVLDTKNKDSVIGRVIYDNSMYGKSSVSNMATAFSNIIPKTFSSIGSLLTPKSKAQSQINFSYDYGFKNMPMVGFSLSEQEDPLIEDPYKNAEDVARLMEGSEGPTIRDNMNRCYGIDITLDANGLWDAVDTGSDEVFQLLLNGGRENCGDTVATTASTGSGEVLAADSNMLKVRTFANDTMNMKAMACWWGDEETCTEVGFGSTTSNDNTATSYSNISTTEAIGPATLKRAQGSWGGYTNGKIPESALMKLPIANACLTGYGALNTEVKSYFLHPYAVVSLVELNKRFNERFGKDLYFKDCYRDYGGQVVAKKQEGSNAATPGKSNHGWALAVDFRLSENVPMTYSSAEYKWLMQEAPKVGWVNPPNMQQGGSGPLEAWHWEYARPVPSSAGETM